MATYLKIKTKYNNVITLLRDNILDSKTIFLLIYGQNGLENYDFRGSIELLYYPNQEEHKNNVMFNLEILLNEYRNNLVEAVTDKDILDQLYQIIDNSEIYWYDYCGYHVENVNNPYEITLNDKKYLIYGSMSKNSSGEYTGFEGIQEVLVLKQN